MKILVFLIFLGFVILFVSQYKIEEKKLNNFYYPQKYIGW